MQLHPTSRPRRVRRLIAVSAAAVAVMIAPTACDYGGAAQLDLPSHPGHHDGMNMDAQEHEVVPVAQTAASASADANAAAKTTAARATERRRGDGDRRVRNYRPVRATIPPPTGAPAVPATPVEPAAPTGTVAPAAPAATDSASASATATAAAQGAVSPGGRDGKNNGLDVLGRDCTASELPAHTGFQVAEAQCVSTAMGEIADESELPSLLITAAPEAVGVGQEFQLKISTRNLVRDRFLGAAAGGYYLESSFLNGEGLQRGHFHTACRILPSTNEAPDSSGAPKFFLATQDNGGGSTPDTVTITVPGIDTAGTLQCTSWAGDGSHRTPMMSRANQTPAIDSVRIRVGGDVQPVQNVDAPAAQQDAAAQAEAQQEEAAQQPDQDGAALGQQEAAEAAVDTTAPAAEESAAADESAASDDESAAAEESAAADASTDN